jgi:hypothetical protein
VVAAIVSADRSGNRLGDVPVFEVKELNFSVRIDRNFLRVLL